MNHTLGNTFTTLEHRDETTWQLHTPANQNNKLLGHKERATNNMDVLVTRPSQLGGEVVVVWRLGGWVLSGGCLAGWIWVCV